jgi:hypothetical protein
MHARACKQRIAVHRFSGNAEVEKSAARVHGGSSCSLAWHDTVE